MHKITRLFLFVFIILFAVFVAGILFFTKETPPPQVKETVAMTVKTLQVTLQSLQPQIQFIGRLQPSAQTNLRFEVSGQLIKRTINPGQMVKKGAALLEVNPRQYQLTADKMKALHDQEVFQNQQETALLAISKEALQLQQQEMERMISLNSKGLLSLSKLEQKKRTLLQKEAELTRLQYSVKKAAARENVLLADLKQAQLNLENTRLRAPFTGTINSVNVNIGDYIDQTQTVASLIKIDFLELPLQIDTKTTSQLSLHQKIDIEINQKTVAGEITAIQRNPNPRTLTHTLIIRIPGAELVPGWHAKATLTLTALHNKLTIPETAILHENNKAFVFLVKENILHKTVIILGQRIEAQRVVRGGINKDETIIAENVAAMSDGLIVQFK